MLCADVQELLLHADSPAAPSADVKEHLRGCDECGRLQQQLVRLLDEVKTLPLPPEHTAAKASFKQAFDSMSDQSRPWARRWSLWHATVIAAALFLALGLRWLFVHDWNTGSEKTNPLAQPAPSVAPSLDSRFVIHILDHYLAIAEAPATFEQLKALAAMAHNLQSELHRLAKQEADNHVLVARLYERVVRDGLVGNMVFLTPEQQRELAPPLVAQLRLAEQQAVELATNASPAVAHSLRRASVASAEANRVLLGQTPQPTPFAEPPLPIALTESDAFVDALVMHGLRLTEKRDPLGRAEVCSDVADLLTEQILRSTKEGDKERTARLTEHLGNVLMRGVIKNMSGVVLDDSDDARAAQFQKVWQRSEQSLAVLNNNLERVPAAARPGLERALEASRHGRERAMQAMENRGKGKGKSKGKSGQMPPSQQKSKENGGFVPPGLRNKHQSSALDQQRRQGQSHPQAHIYVRLASKNDGCCFSLEKAPTFSAPMRLIW